MEFDITHTWKKKVSSEEFITIRILERRLFTILSECSCFYISRLAMLWFSHIYTNYDELLMIIHVLIIL